ncbi:hypothetical protein BZA77DRAFT_305070 [Pyronema omphalodes]|nr:hypothetical protein BZA77DRAFT_305070 [Pyronema omphalodes]
MNNTVKVSNIAPTTTKAELVRFFSYCGKISTVEYDLAAHTATIEFENAAAAHTAELLDQTHLDDSVLNIETVVDNASESNVLHPEAQSDAWMLPENKPKSAILAEYLANGYRIGDVALQKAIDLDNKYKLTSTFATYLGGFIGAVDNTTGISETAKVTTDKAKQLANYFLETSAGKTIVDFYQKEAKQVMDIHNEALRLKGLKDTFGPSADGKPFDGMDDTVNVQTCGCKGKGEKCICNADACACSGCDMDGKPIKAEAEAEAKAAPSGQLQHAIDDIKGTVKDVTTE